MLNWGDPGEWTIPEMDRFNTNLSTSYSGRRSVRDLSLLGRDLRNAVKSIGKGMAQEIGNMLLESTEPPEHDTGRLQASGFLFINGTLIKSTGTDKDIHRSNKIYPGRKKGKRNPYPHVVPPDAPQMRGFKGTNRFQIDVQWHTPKPVNKGRTFYIWRSRKWFDYARYIMTKTISSAFYTESIQKVRQYIKAQSEAAIRRALK
jgi:hypothetical protein